VLHIAKPSALDLEKNIDIVSSATE